jgi:hypothetical protein
MDPEDFPPGLLALMDRARAQVWSFVDASAKNPGETTGEQISSQLLAMSETELRALAIAALRDLTLMHIRTGERIRE